MYGTFCRACGGIILTHGKCKQECGPRFPDKQPYRDFCERCGERIPNPPGENPNTCPRCGRMAT